MYFSSSVAKGKAYVEWLTVMARSDNAETKAELSVPIASSCTKLRDMLAFLRSRKHLRIKYDLQITLGT